MYPFQEIPQTLPSKMSKPICRGICKNGARCKCISHYSHGFCWTHSNQQYLIFKTFREPIFLQILETPVPLGQKTMTIIYEKIVEKDVYVDRFSTFDRALISMGLSTKKATLYNNIKSLYNKPVLGDRQKMVLLNNLTFAQFLDSTVAFIENSSNSEYLWTQFIEAMCKNPKTTSEASLWILDTFAEKNVSEKSYPPVPVLPVPSAPPFIDEDPI